MRRKNLNKLTIMLASAMVTSVVGGMTFATKTTQAADAKTYALTEVFSTKNAVIDQDENKVASFTLENEGSVYIKRDLAFKWYQSATASYFNTSFTFTDTKYDSVSIEMEAPSAWASEDDKAKNVLTFEKTSGGFDVYVNKSDKNDVTNVAALEYSGEYIGKPIVVSFDDNGCDYGQYNIRISVDGNDQTMATGQLQTGGVVYNNGGWVSRFINVGQTYAKFSLNKMHPLTFSAKVTDNQATEAVEDKTVILLNSINGQAFNNITEDDKVTDNAPAVLVLGEEVSAFQLGTAFNVVYDYMDVLSKNVTITREYYQYNPAHKEVKYNTLNNNVVFQETTIPGTEGNPNTSVYKERGQEFVSVKFTLNDGTFTEENNDNGLAKAVTYLAWYAQQDSVVKSADAPKVTTEDNIDYISVIRKEEAPVYRHWKLNADGEVIAPSNNAEDYLDKTYYVDQDITKELSAAKAFQTKVTEAAKDCFAGGEALELEAVDRLISDNNGYRGMKFTISYYTPTSTKGSPSSASDKAYNAMEIPVASEGFYQFKIFAKDKAGNQMQYYVDGELVEVNATNVWDIDEIPSFSFWIEGTALKVKEDGSLTARKDTEVLDTTYTFDAFETEGGSNLKETYVLYKLKASEYTALKVKKDLNSVTYEELAGKIRSELTTAGSWEALLQGRTYTEYYLSVYSKMLAENDAALAELIVKCFEKVGEPDDHVNYDTNKWEAYEWDPNTRSFKTVDKGTYLLIADFSETEKPTERVAAYKIVEVSDKVDEIAGVNDWLENNKVSVILFAVAGVMLILIIVLLLIKPSDESLEEITKDKANKKEKDKKN